MQMGLSRLANLLLPRGHSFVVILETQPRPCVTICVPQHVIMIMGQPRRSMLAKPT